jgi:NAD(P)-dependent dehydrogenase (short-subunit alcohol dehydrogenase family)
MTVDRKAGIATPRRHDRRIPHQAAAMGSTVTVRAGSQVNRLHQCREAVHNINARSGRNADSETRPHQLPPSRKVFQMTTSPSKPNNRTSSPDQPVRDKVVVITGASSGLGLETAKQLAGQGGEVVMIVRDRARGEHARSQVAEIATGKSPVLLIADLSVQADIRRVAQEVRNRYDHVDILINNAGNAFNNREQSADGIELTWATNQLAPFLLTNLLLPTLIAAPAGRVVNVTTEVYSRKLDLDNLQGERKYSWMGAYRTSKLRVVLFTTELARRIAGSGVTVASVSPGPTKTNFGGGGPSGLMGVVTGVLKHTPLLKPADKAAEGIVWAATSPELAGTPAALYMHHKQLKLKGAATDPNIAAKIWAISEEQTGVGSGRSSVAAVTAAGGSDA